MSAKAVNTLSRTQVTERDIDHFQQTRMNRASSAPSGSAQVKAAPAQLGC